MNTAYDIGVRLSMDTTGFSSAASIAMKLFGDLEGSAGRAESAVAAVERRMQRSAGAMQRHAADVTTGTQALASADNDMRRAIARNDPTGLATAHNQRLAAIDATTAAQGKLNTATVQYTTLAGQQQTQIDAAASAHERLNTAMKGTAMVAGGVALTAVGVGLVSFMDSAVQKAMALQTIMIGVAERTGVALNDPRLAQLQDQATRIGLTNQMSTTEVMGVAQAASRAGITDLGQLSHMLKPLANYSEVMLRATGADPDTSARTAVEFAHLYGAFGDKTIGGHTVHGKTVGGVSDTQYLVNELGKAMQIVPGTQGQFLTLLSSFVGTERPLYKGKPPQALISDTISEAVLLSQMGQGQRGGNQIARIITNMMGGARGKMAQTAIQDIQRVSHVHFANAQGQINDPSLLLKALAITGEKLSPQQTLVEFSHAFAANGARLAGLFADPVVGARLATIATDMKAMPNLDAQQQAYNASTAGQFNQARKNWDSAMTELGILWLPAATQAANALAGFTGGLVRFSQQHHTLMAFAATFVAVTAAASLIVGPLVALAGIVAIVGGVTGLALLGPVIVTVVAIGAAIAAVTLIIMNWGAITRTVGSIFSAFGTTLHALMQWIADHIPGFGFLKDTPKQPATTVPSAGDHPAATFFTTPVRDAHGHVVKDAHGHALTTTQQAVRATRTDSGTVGLPTTIYVPPVGAAPPGKEAVWDGARWIYVPTGARLMAYHGAKADYDLPIKHNARGYYVTPPARDQSAPVVHRPVTPHTATTATATARGGDTHIHVHPGAAAIHIHPGPTHDHKKIAQDAAKAAGDHLGHHIANALRTSGALPSTTRPTLHQIGMS